VLLQERDGDIGWRMLGLSHRQRDDGIETGF
jgi:hypothetical protein